MRDGRLYLLLGAAALVVACAQRPVLYPNGQLAAVGRDVAERDIDACIEAAEAAGADSGEMESVAGSTAGGAGIGAAAGAASGAVRGRPGRGAAAGAAGGAAGGLVRGLFRGRGPDPVHRRFVEECLRERGYRPIGWS